MVFLKNYFCKALHVRFVLQGFRIYPSFFYVLAKLNQSFMMCVTEYISFKKNTLKMSLLRLSHHNELYRFQVLNKK